MFKDIKKILYITLLSLLASATGFSQKVSIQGKLDKTEIKTGEQAAIDLIIRTNNLPKTKFYLKENKQLGEPPYTIIEFGAIDTVNIEGNLKEISAKLILTSFDSTLITIPPIVVETPDGIAETQPQALKVIQPQVDSKHPENFKDIKKPWELTLSIKDWLEIIFTSWIFWAVIAMLIVGYLVYKFVTRKQVVTEPIVIEAPLSLIERIRQELSILEEKHLPEQGLFKEYYSELIYIIKDYLDSSRNWNTMEMTSSELLEKLQAEKLKKEQISTFNEILKEADLSKFAKSNPSIEGALHSFKSATWLLNQLDDELSRTLTSEPK